MGGGAVAGILYCTGDTVGEMHKFKDEDFREFLASLPPNTLHELIKQGKGRA